jgi:uncharacterized membrane protein
VKILGLGENFMLGQKFWVWQKCLVWAKREYYDGVPCANFAVSLFISFPAAPNLVIHHHLASRTQGRKEF